MRIYLLGFMGTGKSYWGNRWAVAHELAFYDLDSMIEKEEQQSIMEIFEKKGEDYFRRKEALALRSTVHFNESIVSCGGGSPCFFDNMEWMNANGFTIFLQASPAYILQNIEKEKGRRPLMQHTNEAELEFFVEQKLKERMPYYSQAKLTLPADDLSVRSFECVLRELRPDTNA